MGTVVSLLPAESRPETPGNHGPLFLEGGIRAVFYSLHTSFVSIFHIWYVLLCDEKKLQTFF